MITSVQSEKKYYVYELAYPESMGGVVFYVGKGSKRRTRSGIIDRIDEHEMQALQPLEDIKRWGRNVEKWRAIHAIWNNGEQVVKRKVYETDNEQDAYARETKLIEKYGVDNLTNKPNGGQPHANKARSATKPLTLKIDFPISVSDEKQHTADEMLSANQAGKILGVSGKTVVRMMEAGEVPGYKIGNAWKFMRGEVEAYRDAQKYQPGKKVE